MQAPTVRRTGPAAGLPKGSSDALIPSRHSPHAAARAVALVLLADGHLSRSEDEDAVLAALSRRWAPPAPTGSRDALAAD
jgi:hypothetical protein